MGKEEAKQKIAELVKKYEDYADATRENDRRARPGIIEYHRQQEISQLKSRLGELERGKR